MPSDKTLDVRPGSLDSTSMRYHELWLQRWLYSKFFVREGYPVPVVFASPMDAFSLFSKLWSDANNPFDYLLALKDENGTPLYEPHPSPIRYPLISVMRKGVKYRQYQNFSIHRWRHVNWPTVSDAGSVVPGKEQIGTGLVKCDLGNVTVSRMPMAWDYRFQIDHYCLRPDTQAFYLERLMSQFWRTGGILQTWLNVDYPGWGTQYIRAYIDGEIDQSAPDEESYQDKNVEFRTSYTLTVEGFMVDLNYQVLPTLWKLIANSATPDQLDKLLEPAFTTDLRTKGFNQVLESRPDVPSAGTCQTEGNISQYLAAGTVYILLGDLAGTNPGDNVFDPNHDTPSYPTDPIFDIPRFSYGIPSTLVFGTPIFTSGGTGVPPVISGTITPAAAGMSVVLDAVGTFTTDSNGFYSGTVPYGYSGTAVPNWHDALSFTPPIRTYFLLTTDQANQNYTWLNKIVTTAAGTDRMSSAHDFGNISEYEIFNYVNPGTFASVAFGTHFLATVPTASGTEFGTFTTRAFGTYLSVVVFDNVGTDTGTFASVAFGTAALVVTAADAGTGAGTFATSAFGTATQIVFQVSGGTDAVGIYTGIPFGTYAAA